MKTNKGFTLIELLVVIAIIGILSSVVLASLNDARGKARTAQVQGNLSGILPGAVICLDDSAGLLAASSTTDGGGFICSGSSTTWADLPGDWAYGSVSSDTAAGTFSYSASSTADGAAVSCDQTGCTTS